MQSNADGKSDTHNGQPLLSRAELQRLTLFKWRYSLEALGFSAYQVEQLMFLTWLRVTARVLG